MNLETAADLLAKMGNPTRLEIVRLLVRAGDRGLPVGKIQRQLGIPASTLTHHLGHLKSAGIIRQRRERTTLLCTMEYPVLNALVDYLTEHCCADTDDAGEAA